MFKRLFGIFVLTLAMLTSAASFAQNEGDRVIAIVGNDVILESDFQYQLQLYARQNQLPQIPPQVAQQIFQQMITDKIIYAKALQDSVEVTDDEINRELDFRIQSLTQQMGSMQRLEEVYGMSIARIRLQLKDDLTKKLLADKLRRQRFSGGIKVTDKEVNEFYQTYRDSLPPASSEYEISQIFLTRKVSEPERQAALQTARQILDSIRMGVSFEELARRNSADVASGQNGGDLGTAGRGAFVKPFEDAVFSMREGEVSEPVETEFGIHIIRLDSKTGETVRSRHILIPFPKLESSDFETINFLKDLREKILSGAMTFEEASKQYSENEESRVKGGYEGFVAVERLDSAEIDALRKISDGEITEPIKIGSDNNYGYSILKRHSYSEGHNLTLAGDYDKIKRYAEFFKENKELEKWINEIRESIYVDIRY
jgi:peptidyl-prolyl cis-trans isomerase SurA